jgi:eukaryotic-like serine/threonine-protein kinase
MVSYTSIEDRIAKILGDRYELIELVGKGGFASVFRVRNRRLQRTEALKVLSETLTEDSDFAKRFEQEARVAASLDHPNIVKIYDYGSAEDFVWFSMQFIDGPSVGRELRSRERFDEGPAARIAVSVLDALYYSHARGVIHRDIKPDNIMLDRDGRPYLTDFGVAKSQVALVKTHAGTLLGSPAYMSPEQLQGKPLDGRSDLYSLGVTLYKMLAGGLPFTADDTFRATMKRLSEPPEPLTSRRPEIHPMIAEIVMRSLERDAADRYADAAAMRDEFESFLVDVTPPRVRLSGTATRADKPTPTGFPTPTPGYTPPRAMPASPDAPTQVSGPASALPAPPPIARVPPVPPAPPQPPMASVPPAPLLGPPDAPKPAVSGKPSKPPLPLAWMGLALGVLAVIAVVVLFARRQTPQETSTAPSATAPAAAPTHAPAPTIVPTPQTSTSPPPAPTVPAPAAVEEPTAAPKAPRPTRRPAAPVPTPARKSAETAPVVMGPARPAKTMAETIALAPLTLASEAAAKHHNESVGLTVTVGADGSVKNAKVILEVCPECDRAALEAIRRSRFKPALDADGKPMESTLAISVRIP